MLIAIELTCDYGERQMAIKKVDLPETVGSIAYTPTSKGWIVIQMLDHQYVPLIVDYWRKDRDFTVIYGEEE